MQDPGGHLNTQQNQHLPLEHCTVDSKNAYCKEMNLGELFEEREAENSSENKEKYSYKSKIKKKFEKEEGDERKDIL